VPEVLIKEEECAVEKKDSGSGGRGMIRHPSSRGGGGRRRKEKLAFQGAYSILGKGTEPPRSTGAGTVRESGFALGRLYN